MRFLLPLCLSTILAIPAWADKPVDYQKDIKPILAEKCFACHGALKQKGRLRVDAVQLLRQGGRRGPVIVAGKADESTIVSRVTDEGRRLMPPEGLGEKLNPKQLALLRAWINQGAVAADEPVPPDPRQHWAYQKPVRAPVPKAGRSGWVINPVDSFVAEQHAKFGLAPVAATDKSTLLRRLYLDVIGLPPTRQELLAFLKDKSPNAYEKVVDRLLASPRHGERWGRHWMDVWRYSDWSGYRDQIRNSQRHIWRWRDWIIESVNADKGYDRMIVEMLAGDEVDPANPETLRATGYLARNWYKFNRNYWLDNCIEHTSKAFLGITMNCAKCHDHKYDPIAQENYYMMRAFFEPHNVRTDPVPGQLDPMKDGLPRAYDANAKTQTFVFARGNEKHPEKDFPIDAGLPEVFGIKMEVKPVELPVEAYYPFLQEQNLKTLRAAAQKKLADARAALAKAKDDARKLAGLQVKAAEANLVSLEARIAADQCKYKTPKDPKNKDLALKAGQAGQQLAVYGAEIAVLQNEQAVAKAKKALKPKDKKSKDALAKAEKNLATAQKKLADAQAALKKPQAKYTALGKEYPRTSTGRRTALARWIANKDNPLTARVAVNHIWLRHFGAPLVDNVFDLGLRSQQPRHAKLLDWLAVELMDKNWSMKHVHKLMVMSQTYRLASASRDANQANIKKDPDNLYLWRMNSRRLEAEAVRDSVLHVAGNLDFTMGGADIDQKQGLTNRRRSVYFRHAYEKKMKFLEMFDLASENECYRRSESVVPQQALALANSSVSFEQSRLLARKLSQKQTDAAFVGLAFEQVLSRQPTAQELGICQKFLAEQSARLADPKKLTPSGGVLTGKVKPSADPKLRARENLIHVLMNHNDFVTIR